MDCPPLEKPNTAVSCLFFAGPHLSGKDQGHPNSIMAWLGDTPKDGQSSMRSLGRGIRARARATICCSPPDNLSVSIFRFTPFRFVFLLLPDLFEIFRLLNYDMGYENVAEI